MKVIILFGKCWQEFSGSWFCESQVLISSTVPAKIAREGRGKEHKLTVAGHIPALITSTVDHKECQIVIRRRGKTFI